VALLIARFETTGYTAFLESSRRLREAFALRREYPTIVFHEDGFPEDHKAHIQRYATHVQFHSLRGVWGSPTSDFDDDDDDDRRSSRRRKKTKEKKQKVVEREATDRSLGYNHMCRFFSWQMFRVAVEALGLDYVMRVDDDVWMLRRVAYDPFELMWRARAAYAYGCRHREEHDVTRDTLPGWLRDQVGGYFAENGNADSVIEDMYFNNLFAANVAWWFASRDVRWFMKLVGDHGGVYRYRWGDAPLQTAAVRYAGGTVVRFPDLVYVHFSTDNLVVDGAVRCLTCDEGRAFLRGFARSRHDLFLPAAEIADVASMHRAAFLKDLRRVEPALPDDVDDALLLRAALEMSIWCDGAGRIDHLSLLPLHCCCRAGPFHSADDLAALRPRFQALLDASSSSGSSTGGGGGRRRSNNNETALCPFIREECADRRDRCRTDHRRACSRLSSSSSSS